MIAREPLPTGKIYVKIKHVQSAMKVFNTTCNIAAAIWTLSYTPNPTSGVGYPEFGDGCDAGMGCVSDTSARV